MTDKTKFVKADGTLLEGKDAELELARYDAEKMIKDLKLENSSAPKDESMKASGEDKFKGKGRRLKTAVGSKGSPTLSTNQNKSSATQASSAANSEKSKGSPKETEERKESKARDEAEEKEMREMVKHISPQMQNEAQEILKFSKSAGDYEVKFSLDLDILWSKAFNIINSVQGKINEVGCKVISFLDQANEKAESTISTLEKWGDMSKNIRDGSEMLKGEIGAKTNEITGYTKNLNDRAQKLASSATSTLNNPLLKNVADMSVLSETVGEMAGTGQHLTDTFNSLVDAQSETLQKIISELAEKVIKMGESSGLFEFIRELAGEIRKHLKELSKILMLIKEHVSSFLNKINGLFEMIFTGIAKLRSIIEGVLGLDISLMKEALKNGTIRLADVRIGRVEAHVKTDVNTKSSTDITGAKVTACNVMAAGIVTDNSKSGHIEVTPLDVKALNVDAAAVREGKSKRNLAYLKGAGINAGNVRATAIDNREVETAVAGVSAAEVNVGNIEAFGLGRKGTHKHTTLQPSLNVGNVAIGVRRSTGTNIAVGPQLSAFNLDLTVGAPSVTNFLNQIRPGQAFGNIAIPFFGGGGGEAGGKSSGGKDGDAGNDATKDGMAYETAGASTYGLARDTVEYGRAGSYVEGGCKTSNSSQSLHGDSHGEGTQSSTNGGGNKVAKPSSGSASTNGHTHSERESASRLGIKENCKIFDKGDSQNENSKDGYVGAVSASEYRPGEASQSQNGTQTKSAHVTRTTQKMTSVGKHSEETIKGTATNKDSDTSNTNVLGSGIYKKGDAARDRSEDDYQSRLAALVKGQVKKKVGKTKKADGKKTETKHETKPKEKLDNDAYRRQLQKECQEELGQAEESPAGSSETGLHEDKKTKTKPKAKAKPWGEHGNIHGFSTLGTESDKEIKKLGDSVFGFADG